jgi:hypothetical protein
VDNDQKVRRANEADRLLKSELWQEAWEIYRLKVFTAIENAKTDDGTIRGKLMLGVMNDIRTYFESVLKSGQFAAHEIKLEDERKRSWFNRAA